MILLRRRTEETYAIHHRTRLRTWRSRERLLDLELLKVLYAKTRTRESVSVDMSDASSAKKESIGMN